MRRAVVILLLFVLTSPAAASVAGTVRDGNALFAGGEYAAAAEKYEAALKNDPESATIHFNLGTSLYKAGEYEPALSHLRKALLSDDPQIVARAQFNLGNTLYKTGLGQEDKNIAAAIEELEKSLDYFQQGLKGAAPDEDAQYNYDVVERELERLRQKQQQQKQQQQNQQQSSQQQQGPSQDQQGQQQPPDQPPSSDTQDQHQAQPQNPPGQEPPPSPDPSSGQQRNGEGPQQQDEQGGQGGQPGKEQDASGSTASGTPAEDSQDVSEQAARQLINDFKNTEGVERMFFLIPRDGRSEAPVGRDW